MIVFLHGVPETAALWDKVRAHIEGASVALSLPGFGCTRPAGFSSTKDEYVEWVVGELDRIGEPVDLVGHDWGAGLTYRIATAHGDRLRSWAADVGNVAHPDYVWHDFAQIWQTPGEGEAFFAGQADQPIEAQAATFEMFGVPADDAREMASWADDEMAASILALYRSATPNPHADWGPWSPTSVPGLVLHPTEDPFGDEAQSNDVARMFGARHERLEGLGHWWALQDPAASAAALRRFWDSLA